MDNSFKLGIQKVFKLSILIGLNVGNEINNPVKISKAEICFIVAAMK